MISNLSLVPVPQLIFRQIKDIIYVHHLYNSTKHKIFKDIVFLVVFFVIVKERNITSLVIGCSLYKDVILRE